MTPTPLADVTSVVQPVGHLSGNLLHRSLPVNDKANDATRCHHYFLFQEEEWAGPSDLSTLIGLRQQMARRTKSSTLDLSSSLVLLDLLLFFQVLLLVLRVLPVLLLLILLVLLVLLVSLVLLLFLAPLVLTVIPLLFLLVCLGSSHLVLLVSLVLPGSLVTVIPLVLLLLLVQMVVLVPMVILVLIVPAASLVWKGRGRGQAVEGTRLR